MNVGEVRCKKITKDGEMLCVDLYCLSPFRDTDSLLSYHINYVIITPPYNYVEKFSLFFIGAFMTLTHMPQFVELLSYLLCTYIIISQAKSNLLWETPFTLFLPPFPLRL